MRRLFLSLTLAGLALAAMTGGAAAASPSPQGAVFTLSNSPAGNRVLVWERAPNGALLAVGAVSTGGTGTGAGLGSQGALALSGNHRWLYAVNPGSDEVSVFRVYGTHLQLMEVAPSGGDMPISITAHGELVYVLNAGGDGNIQGFQRSATGILQDIDGSNLPLSQPAPGPAQIEFAPNGRHLVVTEKATNRIDYYRVHADGSASGPHWRASAGQTPFGFEFSRNGTLVVSEAAGGAVDGSSASSYHFRPNGNLRLLDGPVATTETAACWTAITRDGRFAYVTNNGSASISGYSIGTNGDLTLLNSDGVTATTGAGPIDITFDFSSRHMYVLNAGSDTVTIFDVAADGSLTADGWVPTPDGAAGLVAI
ncbi:MAG TPA: beta-propeller fold lactonase family protein [Candidatus Limnocylindrales bacterium]